MYALTETKPLSLASLCWKAGPVENWVTDMTPDGTDDHHPAHMTPCIPPETFPAWKNCLADLSLKEIASDLACAFFDETPNVSHAPSLQSNRALSWRDTARDVLFDAHTATISSPVLEGFLGGPH